MTTSFTSGQKADLVRFVRDIVGSHVKFPAFTACLLGLFEDIPGFETKTPGEELIREIWELYQ
jgi:hypothetical protein